MKTLTYEVAYSAAADAANRQMQSGGRTSWSEEDYDLAVKEFNRLAKNIQHRLPCGHVAEETRWTCESCADGGPKPTGNSRSL